MMVEIEIGGLRATARGYAWERGDEPLLTTLRNDLLARQVDGAYDPFPARTIAQEALDRYGGRIISEQAPAYVAGRDY
jgi:hypothetical protein